MTRINCVPVQELTTKHLIAEWRELPRVFRLAEAAYIRNDNINAPETYVLGSGHVRFFYKRLGYVKSRWYELRDEMLHRNYLPGYDSPPNPSLPDSWWQQWTPSDTDIKLNRQRINERLAATRNK